MNEITAHESQSNEAHAHAKEHADDADDVLRARSLGYAPRHAKSRDAVAEMENGSKHAEHVEHNHDRILEIILKKFK